MQIERHMIALEHAARQPSTAKTIDMRSNSDTLHSEVPSTWRPELEDPCSSEVRLLSGGQAAIRKTLRKAEARFADTEEAYKTCEGVDIVIASLSDELSNL